MGCVVSTCWLPQRPIHEYNRALYDSFHTGDIILFEGSSFVSRGIELVTESAWSHIGFVIETAQGEKYLLESSRCSCHQRDALSHNRDKTGCRLVLLDKRIRGYGDDDTVMAVRHIRFGKKTSRRKLAERMLHLCTELSSVEYNKDLYDMFMAVYDGPGGEMHGREHSRMFCSELVAYVAQRLRWLEWEPSHKEYVPRDFDDRQAKYFPLTGRVEWSECRLFTVC